MKNKFLTKNTKVTIKEETSPNGLKTYEKVHKEDATINKDALKAIGKKLEDYYGDELKELDPVLKVDREQESTGDVNVYDVEALGSGMQGLKYDDEGSETFKTFMKRMDDLNDTSEYDKEFGTKDGFGETDEKNDTYEKLTKASDEYKKNKYDGENPQHQTPRVRVTNESKSNKMKRLNFKNEFTSVEEVKELIPENYKVDEHTFLMTDGNQTYKMRWDKSLNEATVLNFRNEKSINENVDKMKKLYDFQYGDTNTKTNDYTKETKVFKTLMESVKGKDLLSD
tara:strand:+ start:12030 stop:12878 length:849 start_codon:yes stop_codon:yes gene_type:complete